MKDMIRKKLIALRGVWPLYGAAFMMSIVLSTLWTAMPFIVRNIGGTEAHVGYAWAANMVGYVASLLIAGFALGQHNPKNATRTAVVIVFVSMLVMCSVVYVILSRELTGNLTLIWTLIIAGTFAGAAMVLYWPFLMSWVSEDLEGHGLNRRLGTYNGSWSAAAIIGPLLSGIFVETSTLLPIIFTAFGMIVCFLFLNNADDSSVHALSLSDEAAKPKMIYESMDKLNRFRWISRITLFSSWACLGVTRSQFALVFTGMGYSETEFGLLVMLFGICNFSILSASGRWPFWHFKPALLPVAQVIISISLLMIIFGRTLPVFVLSFIVLGCGFGFAYSSHLYYGTYGAKKRSTRMIIHEATLSTGIIVGSGAGGYIAEHYGLYRPYWFVLGLMVTGLLIQFAILLHGKLKHQAIAVTN
jgi:MFS family permease